MEPLAVEGGEKRRPVFADYHRGGRRLHIGLQVPFPPFPTCALNPARKSRTHVNTIWQAAAPYPRPRPPCCARPLLRALLRALQRSSLRSCQQRTYDE